MKRRKFLRVAIGASAAVAAAPTVEGLAGGRHGLGMSEEVSSLLVHARWAGPDTVQSLADSHWRYGFLNEMPQEGIGEHLFGVHDTIGGVRAQRSYVKAVLHPSSSFLAGAETVTANKYWLYVHSAVFCVPAMMLSDTPFGFDVLETPIPESGYRLCPDPVSLAFAKGLSCLTSRVISPMRVTHHHAELSQSDLWDVISLSVVIPRSVVEGSVLCSNLHAV